MKLSGNTDKQTARILAIETSTELLGVALVDDTGIRCEFTAVEPMIHSKMLLPLSKHALETVGWAPHDLDCLAVSGGPGSFTGLRIGFAMAQGLGFALDKPIAKVPTFEVYLRQCSPYPRVGIVQGRARSQTVCALYEKAVPEVSHGGQASGTQSGFNEIVPLTAMGSNEFLDYLVDYLGDTASLPVWIAGDAADQFAAMAGEAGIECVRTVDSHLRLPAPGVLGLIGVEMFLEGKAVSASSALPDYYRKSQAEVVFACKTKKGDRGD
ncbi:MAG TPA: tRNA (adenosine(37)-N6)-threonylcarbamoyltransferase complex dimerization subunit type 1 TsaB [Firmicutes bacterium]|nr:tRNA (adenosine(37)-N6)-threonylcarbamoyltransferase complex dimerization subunit type 1 TsaB [Bacillota bacterium]